VVGRRHALPRGGRVRGSVPAGLRTDDAGASPGWRSWGAVPARTGAFLVLTNAGRSRVFSSTCTCLLQNTFSLRLLPYAWPPFLPPAPPLLPPLACRLYISAASPVLYYLTVNSSLCGYLFDLTPARHYDMRMQNDELVRVTRI